jgi:hypothetical protein
MALVTLFSAGGSPGVTTTALGLALAWNRPALLVDADPSAPNTILTGYFKGTSIPSATLADLSVSHRQGTLVTDLPRLAVPITGTAVTFVPGLSRHVQASSMLPVWEPLSAALRSLEVTGQDVIVDAGRLGLAGSPSPLIHNADLALLVVRSSIPAVFAAASWADTLREEFDRVGALGNLGLIVVGPGRPSSTSSMGKALQLPVVATIDWDPSAAQVWSEGADQPRKFESAAFTKSIRAAQAGISSTIVAARRRLAPIGHPHG